MDLGKILKKENIIMDLGTTTKEETLKKLIALIKESGAIDNEDLFLQDVYEREAIGITGIGNGISIPHGKSDAVVHTALAIGKSSSPIQWETLDDEPVHLVILFAVRNDDRETVHVRLLSKVATVLGDDEACEAVMSAKSEDEIIKIFIDKQ